MASIGPLALSVHTRTAQTLQTLRFNFVQQLRKLIIDSCDSRGSQAASSNIGQHISCQAAGMITLGNLMSSCSERQSGWTVSHLECIWVSPCIKRCHYPQKRKQQVRGFRPSSSHMWCYDIFIYVYDCICNIWVPQVGSFHRSPFKRCARNLSKRTVPWCHCEAARHALNSAVNLEVLKQGYTFTPVIHQGIKRNQTSNCV